MRGRLRLEATARRGGEKEMQQQRFIKQCRLTSHSVFYGSTREGAESVEAFPHRYWPAEVVFLFSGYDTQ